MHKELPGTQLTVMRKELPREELLGGQITTRQLTAIRKELSGRELFRG
jgi:hypothetical protein